MQQKCRLLSTRQTSPSSKEKKAGKGFPFWTTVAAYGSHGSYYLPFFANSYQDFRGTVSVTNMHGKPRGGGAAG